MVVTVDEHEHIVGIRPDREDTQTLGYGCFKGLQAVEAHYGGQRLLWSLKRMPDGSFRRIALEEALDEIATRLRVIIDRCGGEAIAGYRGNGGCFNASVVLMLKDWLRSCGSHKVFTAFTIDQSAKYVAAGRMGIWLPGKVPMHRGDVVLLVGGNPMLSVLGNLDPRNPSKRFHQAKNRGMKLIVIDPRFTETARLADFFLQPLPGEDAAIFAALLHIILERGWEDKEFCARYVSDLDELREALMPFTAEYVSERAGVSAGKLTELAEIFARKCRTGAAWSGTGPDMGPFSNLAEHLIETLNVVCGRMLRQGDRIDNPGVLTPRQPRKAAVVSAQRWWDSGYKSRIGQQGLVNGELPCGILADEILEPGEGQIRALINHGGNPASAVPDQRRIVDALRSLDLLVSIEPYMTNTARLSHYILAPKLQYERADLPLYLYETCLYPTEPFTRYTPPVAKPPAGSEVVDDWYVFWSLARRLGFKLEYLGVPLDMNTPPTTDDLLRISCRNAPISFEEIKAHPRGLVCDVVQYVEPPDEASTGQFTLAPPDVLAEVRQLRARPEYDSQARKFTHRLAVRRTRDVCNSSYRDIAAIKKRVPYNLAYFNPTDLADAGVGEGEKVKISSPAGWIVARAAADENLRPGVISMSHGFGGLPDEQDYDRLGSSTNLLTTVKYNRQTINAMPEMTGLPLRFDKL